MRAPESSSWLLETYAPPDETKSDDDSTLSVSSYNSIDDNLTEHSVLESISIVSIPLKQGSNKAVSGGSGGGGFHQIRYHPRQNSRLLRHLNATDDFATPGRLKKIATARQTKTGAKKPSRPSTAVN